MSIFLSYSRTVPTIVMDAYLGAFLLTGCLIATTAAEPKLPIQTCGQSEFRLSPQTSNQPQFRFSPDGKLVAGATWEDVKLWSFPDCKLLHDFSGAIQTDCIGFSEGGKEFLALYHRRMEIDHFDTANGQIIRRTKLADVPEEKTATTRKISQDGKWLVAWDQGSAVQVWSTDTGKRKFDVTNQYGVGNCAISNLGVLTVWTTAFIDRYDIDTGKQLSHRRIYEEFGIVASNPQGTLFAGYSSHDKAIVFFDPTNDKQVGAKIPLEQEYKGGLQESALSADGSRFVFWINHDKWDWSRQIAIFDVETGKMVSSFDPPGVYFLEQPVISPDGRYMFPTGGRCVFTPVDTTTGKLVRDVPDHILSVSRLSFTPNGRTLLAGSGDKRQAWSVETGKPGTVFEKWYHTPHLFAVDNNSALVSGIKGGGLRLQNIASGAIERQFEAGTDKYFAELQVSVDRKSFVAMDDSQGGRISRWNIADGKILSERTTPAVGSERRAADISKMIRGTTLGGSRVIRLAQIAPPSKRSDGSINPGHVELILEDWTNQIVTNRLPLPALGRFAFTDNGDGTMFAAVVSDAQSPQPYGEKWGFSHLLVWDVATGWERIRVDREMHNYFDAFAAVALCRDGRLVATLTNRNLVEIWNGFNGYLLEAFAAGPDVSSMKFSDDGTMLATGHTDGSIRLWSTRHDWDQSNPKRFLNSRMAQQYWKDLGEAGRKPIDAWRNLLCAPEQAAEMLRANFEKIAADKGATSILESIAVPLPEDVPELDAASPTPPILRALKQARDKTTSEEARNNYNQLLDTASRPMTPAERQPILGILLAEQLDTAEARKLLADLADGPPGAYQTKVAQAALVRMHLKDEANK